MPTYPALWTLHATYALSHVRHTLQPWPLDALRLRTSCRLLDSIRNRRAPAAEGRGQLSIMSIISCLPN